MTNEFIKSDYMYELCPYGTYTINVKNPIICQICPDEGVC